MTTTETTSTGRPLLRGISEIRAFLRTNDTPVFFVSPTAFNLLGIDRWVRNFFYVTYFDSFAGGHPRVFVPTDRERSDFTSIEDICNHLLRDREVRDWIASRGAGGNVAFVMFDEETEGPAAELGLEVVHPAAALRERLDPKIVTTRLGNEAGVPSVPNVLGRATSYKGADLGVLMTRGRLQTDDEQLTDRCRHWIAGVKGQFAGSPVGPGDAGPPASALRSGFKAA